MRLTAIVVLVTLCSVGVARAGGPQSNRCQGIDLDQGWTGQQKETFWFRPQGSRILPYRWFLALEQKASTGNPLLWFKDSLREMGFVPAAVSAMNPDGLPIGFAKDPTAPEAVGLTCAACHTSRLSFKNTPIVVEGAPALADMTALLTGLEHAITATLDETAKLDRFTQRVQASAGDLKELERIRDVLKSEWNAHWPTHPAGPGRVDAFGLIYNRVLAYDVKAPGNARPVDAPVSYPFLWNTPQHDRVQWNGVARNRFLGSEFWGLLPLIRNVGEVLGVFADLTIHKGKDYESSIRKTDLRRLEEQLGSLRPPAWPAGCAEINLALLKQGQRLYARHCESCHRVLDRADLTTRFKATMTSVFEVGTNLTMLTNFENRYNLAALTTGYLKGEPKFFGRGSKFEETAGGQDMLTHLVLKAIFGKTADEMSRAASPDEQTYVAKLVREITKSDLRYKARPLTGVWATAPFLHNGSVPSLEELLKPPNERVKQFHVGSHELDVDRVGLSTAQTAGSMLFDTTKPGNSNAGHEYGTALSPNDRRALLEYLKIVGQPIH